MPLALFLLMPPVALGVYYGQVDGALFACLSLAALLIDSRPTLGGLLLSQKLEHTLPLILQWDESFDIGSDTGTPVDDQDYQVPFAFTR